MSDSKSLATLVSMVAEIETSLIENDGELSPRIEAILAEIDVKLPEKVENYAGIVARMQLAQEYYSDKAVQLMKMAKSAKAVEARCKENLVLAMEALGVKELLGTETRFKLMETKSVSIDHETLIEESYKHTETVVSIEKKRIGEDLKAGVPVKGASLKINHHVKQFAKGPK